LIYSVIPKRDALEADAVLPITTIGHQLLDYINHVTYETHEIPPGHGKHGHYHIYSVDSYIELIEKINQFAGIRFELVDYLDTDDKVGNGHVNILRVIK
jgi:hypothetical protein